MSREKQLTKFICDVCGHEEISEYFPKTYSTANINAEVNGFRYFAYWDICENCLSKTFFADPPVVKKPDSNKIINKILEWLGSRK